MFADVTALPHLGSCTTSPRIGRRDAKRHIGNNAPQLAETAPDRVVTLRSVAYVVLLLKAASDCALGIPGSSVETRSAPADGYVPIGAVYGENRPQQQNSVYFRTFGVLSKLGHHHLCQLKFAFHRSLHRPAPRLTSCHDSRSGAPAASER